jgi:hypothetical protein
MNVARFALGGIATGLRTGGVVGGRLSGDTPRPVVDRVSGRLQQIVRTEDGKKFLFSFCN